ncbi:MAG: DUF655 domain-containing protein, partial [Nanoarchaeota archaeon]|nr:DUF655 domain-containing protein [Nanoarchaeota archaeon]
MDSKEEQAIVLDFLPNGYSYDKRPSHIKTAIAQAVGKTHFVLLELVPKPGIFLQPHEEVYIGEGKRDKVHHILGKIPISKLTHTAMSELDVYFQEAVKADTPRFIEFFNKA